MGDVAAFNEELRRKAKHNRQPPCTVMQFKTIELLIPYSPMMERKRIRAVCEAGPNYIFHTLSLALSHSKTAYVKRYRDSLPKSDRALVAGLRRLLASGDGGSGDLLFPAVFFPAYLNLDSQAELDHYFQLLDKALGPGNAGPLMKYYSGPMKKITLWDERGVTPKYFSGLRKYRRELTEISGVYSRNFAAYLRDVWPAERRKIEHAARKINAHFDRNDTIAAWESLTGRHFKCGLYQIVLCSAIQNGPNANSLGYDRNVFYSGGDISKALQLISHETGTHLLIDDVMRLISSGQFQYSAVYAAYECLCKFYNSLILHRMPSYRMTQFNESGYLPVYKKLYASFPKPDPAKMLVAAIRELQKTRTK